MIKDYEQRLDENSKSQTETAKAYLKARREYARLHFKMQMEVAKKLSEYKAEKKNLGIDMALLMRLQEAQETNDKEYIELYEKYLYSIGNYKGLDRALDALQNQSISLQSIMKYNVNGELYGSTN